MHTLSQRSKTTQKTISAQTALPARARFGQSREVKSILHFQRTMGNQAVQRMLERTTENIEGNSATTDLARFGHDFGRLRLRLKSPAVIQAKLAVGAPGDIYEQEADRVADQVMRMPEPRLQRVCACGGACPQCQMEQQGQEHQLVQKKHISANDSRGTDATRVVSEVVSSLGHPLDSATRAFFERRFDRDFSQVRVHTDTRAAISARMLDARAFTAGRDITFAPGEYRPHERNGKQLLAHELAHVVQQDAIREQIRSNVDLVVQRVPKNPLKGRKTREVIDTGIAPVIDTVLRGSTFLRPYIKDKLKVGRKISEHFEVVGRGHFKDLYISYAISRGATESKAKEDQPDVAGFYDPARDRIVMRAGAANVGGALHEAIHFFAEPGFRKSFTGPVDEGVTQFYTNFALGEFGLKDSSAYPDEYLNGVSLVSIVGRDALGKAYFVPGYARILFEALSHMYVEDHKGEWLQNLGRRDFVALSGIPHRPRPED